MRRSLQLNWNCEKCIRIHRRFSIFRIYSERSEKWTNVSSYNGYIFGLYTRNVRIISNSRNITSTSSATTCCEFVGATTLSFPSEIPRTASLVVIWPRLSGSPTRAVRQRRHLITLVYGSTPSQMRLFVLNFLQDRETVLL